MSKTYTKLLQAMPEAVFSLAEVVFHLFVF